MELQEPAIPEVSESETVINLEQQEMDRIAFELWQRGSLPEVAEDRQTEIEDVACHASCL